MYPVLGAFMHPFRDSNQTARTIKFQAKKTEPEGSALSNHQPGSGQFFVTHTVRLGSSFAQAFFTVRFVLGVVTFEEHRLRVVFVRQDVRRDAVEEPTIV